MKTIKQIAVVIFLSTIASCDSNIIFDSFRPVNHMELLSNTSKWDSLYFESDSTILITLLKDTFQVHFDIDKKNKNALVFSIDKIDTVGNLVFDKQIAHFKPNNDTNTYKMFDFNAKTNDSWLIKHCGPLTDCVLNIDAINNDGNEIIQYISVSYKPLIPPPPFKQTEIKRMTVSSKYGITEMNIYNNNANSEIKIKNAP